MIKQKFISEELIVDSHLQQGQWLISSHHAKREEDTLKETFRFWPKKDEEDPPKWASRLYYTVVAVVVVMLLRLHALPTVILRFM
ncbi:unnamed protein product [Eruca vesicaria subsp. sativa]|uniref:Uncharacterized protein n=1 Tax=Eruca vesicaria subsp. sativa TaxID=29727 RepID=A0ABC8M5H6_ERUVS|nr:unnamed protein product [Eruca vesicaria subsp. sativa]